MKPPRVPEQYCDEFRVRHTEQIRRRTILACVVSAFIFYAVSAQYIVRRAVSGDPRLFNPDELWIWAAVLAGSALTVAAVRRAKSRAQHKAAAHFYVGFFALMLSGVGGVYPEQAAMFAFYYAFALVLFSFIIPWSFREILFMTAAYMLVYAGYHVFAEKLIGAAVRTPYPRFDGFTDGLICIGIGGLISSVVRRNDNEREVSNFLLLKEIAEKNRRIEDELDLAAKVHDTLVPDSVTTEAADVSVRYIPMRKVGGDYARYHFSDDKRRLHFFISDVTGHGMPAALLVNRVHAEFERLVRDECCPGRLMNQLHRYIRRDFGDSGMFLSAFCGLLDFAERSLAYSGYGHPDQYLHRADGKVDPLASQAGLLGFFACDPEASYETKVRLEPGDGLVLFTDGVTEAMAADGELYGTDRLEGFLARNAGLGASELSAALVLELQKFREGKTGFEDDLIIMSIRTKARLGAPRIVETVDESAS